MTQRDPFEIFLMAPPGLEPMVMAEAIEAGFPAPQTVPGGVVFMGDWADVWRANLCLRGAGRVLARFGEFRAFHLAQLDKRARKLPWAEILRPDVPVRVEASCKKSKIYHAKAAIQRVERAITETIGAPITKDAAVLIKLRIQDDLCTFSIDCSGEGLHKRGHKEAVGKAPMRETMAAMMLRACGYAGDEPVYDPMCGSGTFVIEAAEIARNLAPGRTRGFAFQQLATFDQTHWDRMTSNIAPRPTPHRFYGSDRNTGAISMSTDNAARAGVGDICAFHACNAADITPPDGPPGLVMVNPPYGARIGNRKLLFSLYGALGKALNTRFSGWRVGVVTSDAGLAKACDLPFLPDGPVIAHGGLRVQLHRTAPLP